MGCPSNTASHGGDITRTGQRRHARRSTAPTTQHVTATARRRRSPRASTPPRHVSNAADGQLGGAWPWRPPLTEC
eukprot:24997-Pyramimonas_sp.AAC.1